MLRKQAVLAYAAATVLIGVAIITSIKALRVPWLINRRGHLVSLTKYCVGNLCDQFPTRTYCSDHGGFCGAWKTTAFAIALSLVMELLVLLALLFSWGLRHRKKTVVVVRVLTSIALLFDAIILLSFQTIVDNASLFRYGEWHWVGGYHLVGTSAVCLFAILVEMIFFRSIIKGHDDDDDYNSDDEYFDDDIDTISVDENVPEEDLDFYIFNKQARRAALRGA